MTFPTHKMQYERRGRRLGAPLLGRVIPLTGEMSANADKRVPVFGENPCPPDCHSEAVAEESRFTHFIFVLFEILCFVQHDK